MCSAVYVIVDNDNIYSIYLFISVSGSSDTKVTDDIIRKENIHNSNLDYPSFGNKNESKNCDKYSVKTHPEK